MNKRIACSVFLACLASYALAVQTAPGISVLSYLPTKDHPLLGGGPEQLKVTPITTYEANIIQISS